MNIMLKNSSCDDSYISPLGYTVYTMGLKIGGTVDPDPASKVVSPSFTSLPIYIYNHHKP